MSEIKSEFKNRKVSSIRIKLPFLNTHKIHCPVDIAYDASCNMLQTVCRLRIFLKFGLEKFNWKMSKSCFTIFFCYPGILAACISWNCNKTDQKTIIINVSNIVFTSKVVALCQHYFGFKWWTSSMEEFLINDLA